MSKHSLSRTALGVGLVLFLVSSGMAQGSAADSAGTSREPLPPPASAQTPARPPAADNPAPQQDGATVSGTVLDSTGAVVSGAHVTLTPGGQQVATGNMGQFTFSNVPVAPFRLTVTAPGFATRVFSGEFAAGQLAYLIPPIVLTVRTVGTRMSVVPATTEEIAQEQIKEQEKQRVLGFIPNFYVTYLPHPAPLDTKQKFQLAARTAIDPITFLGAGIVAGAQQVGGVLNGYGPGVEGYAKRFGASYADGLAGIFIGNAILPSLLKQDPRFFYKANGSKLSRLLYALSTSVITKGDNGRWQPNYSSMLASLAVGGIANLYYPPADRSGVATVFTNAAISVGENSLASVFQEFVVPHLTPHLKHRKSPPADGTESKP